MCFSCCFHGGFQTLPWSEQIKLDVWVCQEFTTALLFSLSFTCFSMTSTNRRFHPLILSFTNRRNSVTVGLIGAPSGWCIYYYSNFDFNTCTLQHFSDTISPGWEAPKRPAFHLLRFSVWNSAMHCKILPSSGQNLACSGQAPFSVLFWKSKIFFIIFFSFTSRASQWSGSIKNILECHFKQCVFFLMPLTINCFFFFGVLACVCFFHLLIYIFLLSSKKVAFVSNKVLL